MASGLTWGVMEKVDGDIDVFMKDEVNELCVWKNIELLYHVTLNR